MPRHHEAARAQGENRPAYHRVVRWAIVTMAVWVTLCVVCVELTSFPFVYGWPLLVIGFGGGLPPPEWAVFVDFLAACIAIGATVLVALRVHRVTSHRVQFRLSTLFRAITVCALTAAIWRAGDGFEGGFTVSDVDAQGRIARLCAGPHREVFDTLVALDLTVRHPWLPDWFPPIIFVRLGVLLGLACTIYIAGRSFIMLGKRCLGPTRRKRGAAGPDGK